MATVRYLVTDVERSIAFYTKALGFKLDQSMAPAFARVSNNDLTLWLAGPQSSAARPMPDARRPEPGGWNRFVVEMEDLVSRVAQDPPSRRRSDSIRQARDVARQAWAEPRNSVVRRAKESGRCWRRERKREPCSDLA